MSTSPSAQAGFSAVELLITIFIAAAFVGAGYQLYIAVLRDGSDARNQATASNLAYNYLRKYSSQASSPCAETTIDPAPTIPAGAQYTALGPASITASITCPYAPPSGTSLITVTVNYGPTPQKEVKHVLYVTR